MHIKLDENIPAEASIILTNAGFQCSTALEEGLGGSADADIARVCQHAGFTLVTLDLDFCDIRTYPPEAYQGLIVLRLADQRVPIVLGLMLQALELLKQGERVEGRLWIVEPTRIRIRSGRQAPDAE